MDEQKMKYMAAQLRKPHGDGASEIAAFMAKGNRVLIERTIQKVNPESGDSILEIGMADGTYVNMMAIYGVQYTGCDYSPEMVKMAEDNNRVLVQNSNTSFHCADITDMPFGDAVFNKISTTNTIYFWDDMSAALNELSRVLKDGGELIIGMRPVEQLKAFPMTQHGFNYHTNEDVARYLEEHGFTVIEIVQEEEPSVEVNGSQVTPVSVIIKATK